MKCAENVVSLTVPIQQLYNICERSKLFSAFNGPEFRYIYRYNYIISGRQSFHKIIKN